MTNNWTDIGNASMVLVWGANPSENHPACMAHINRARDNQNVSWPAATSLPGTLGAWANTKGAKLVVVDPRKTRTAAVADKFIRMRPGTDIALVNGVLGRIVAKMENTADTSVTAAQRTQFFAFLNQTQVSGDTATSRNQFFTDGDGTLSARLTTVPKGSKYTDARFVLNAGGTDYARQTTVAATGAAAVGGEAADTIISNLPKKADSVYGYTSDGTPAGSLVTPEPNTVFNRLKAHLAPYTPAVVSQITGVNETDIEFLADAIIANSRCSTISGALATQDPRVAGYRATTMLYAMGLTQHTCGAQNVKSFAVIQTMMGNMGRAGAGINALRGIHNVQGSTDQGLLYGNIPYYSGNPSAMHVDNKTQLADEAGIFAVPYVHPVNGVTYYGFAEAMIAADGDPAGYLVTMLANKVNTTPTTMAEALDPARWDVLVYRATDVANVATYVPAAGTLAGASPSDLISVAAGSMADLPLPGDICWDGTRFRAYVPAFTSGNLHEFRSMDGLAWTATTVYTTTTAVQYPSVVSNGTTTHVYYYNGAGISYLPLTIGNPVPGAAVSLIASGQDPSIELTGGKYVLTYQKHPDGIWQASSAAPTGPFTGVMVYDNDAYDSLDGLASAGTKVVYTPRTGPQPQNITNKPLRGLTPRPLRAVNAYGKYLDTLWGFPVTGTGGRALMNGSYDDAYHLGDQVIVTSPATKTMGLQQRGFFNMTYNFFGNPSWITSPSADKTVTNALYNLWPKGNGDDHITMFRKMITGDTKALVCWGQNPAVTEPNQSKIREGLYNLDTLVVVDMFATETAMCSRKGTGVTYLIPACSHVEEAGSVSNSGRVLQWREKATNPKGKSRADIELMLRFAKALDNALAFTHITGVWTTLGKAYVNAYDELYAKRYSWTPALLTNNFETANSGTAEIWRGAELTPRAPGTVYGSEWIAELMYREMNTPTTGISWLYTGAYNSSTSAVSPTDAREQRYYANTHSGQSAWGTFNRSKSRSTEDPNSTLAFPGWGYSWLVNRRVLYNNGDVPGDVLDFYMGPDSCSRLFVSTNTATLNYSRWYRTIHRMADKPDVALAGPTAVHILPGRFPAHTEPYETPREDLATTWGRNTKGTAQWDLVKTDTNVAAPGRSHNPADFPFVLTTIRCVEHFQGGPITRNNPWNVEAEPEPWVEINSVDALALGITDGQWINVVTARGDSLGNLTYDTAFETVGWSKGFKARVGAGSQGNQRVAPGVVAIPWHWGDQGLSKGSRANDLCIDAGDANTVIPESKACLCKLVKLP